MDDERAIRAMIDTWLTASKAGDTATVLDLMTDDVVFMVPGKEPFGKREFAHDSSQMQGMKIDGTADVREVKILGDWAYLRTYLEIHMTMPDGKNVTHSGYSLTIAHKGADGKWRVARDANLLTPM